MTWTVCRLRMVGGSSHGGMFMNIVHYRITIITLAIASAITAACGGNASLLPVGPSRTSAGASISGTVSGTGVTAVRALDGGAFSLLDSKTSVTVSIVGTNISTTVDRQGPFTLNNVPARTVKPD